MKTALSTLLLAGIFLVGLTLTPKLVASQNNVTRASIVTLRFFNGIVDKSASSCRGKSFYTHAAFIRVIGHYPAFAKSGSIDDSKRELAAFFAHVTHETGHFCYVEEINGRAKSADYCDRGNREYPCAPNKGYYGRGPLQISWNYNYGAAGRSLNLPLLANPDMVATDPMVAFRTALWFWMENVHSVMGQGFGATIRAINGNLECNGGNARQVSTRVGYYTDYCNQFGVSPGPNLRC